jgi:hemerythrin superfamily protein
MFQLLQQQHAQIITLLDRLEAASGSGPPPAAGAVDETGKRRMVDQLVVAASRHEAAEELVFWPAVRRRLDEGPTLSDQGLAQEREARYVLEAMRFETSDAALAGQVRELAAMTRSHVDFEERRVWPDLQSRTGPIGRVISGRELALALRAAPTRPHPRGPDRPGGLATAGLAAALGDRVRDTLGGRHVPPPGRADRPGGPDAADFLEAEHARIDRLLAQVEEDRVPAPDLAARIVKELSVHDSIEREHLYPALRRRLPNGNQLYGEWLAEHGRIAAVLAEIDRRPPHDSHRTDLLGELVGLVRTHIAEEEGMLLPSMRSRMTEEERRSLGRALESGKGRAPTRPHSHIAGAGLGARMARLVAAPLDKTRDAISGRS